ncbi:actin cytoskeleton-regulatory complex protein end3 [Physcia stellaris]|nr:actin cytoskeleton-regulatory complex protein end3 [Physcia stellaris]
MSGEEKSELIRLVAEEVQRMMVEETEKKRKKQQKTQKERKKQREGEAAKRKAEASWGAEHYLNPFSFWLPKRASSEFTEEISAEMNPAPRNPQGYDRGRFVAERTNTEFAGQFAHDIAAARKRQQALSSNQDEAPSPLTLSFNPSTGPAMEKKGENEPAAKKKRGVEAKAKAKVKGEDSSMTDIPAPSADERAVGEADTLRSRISALEQEIVQRGDEATRRDNEMLRLRLQVTTQQGQLTSANQTNTTLQQELATSRQARQQAEQQARQAQEQAREASELARQALDAQQKTEQQLTASALDRERVETRGRARDRLSSSLVAAQQEMNELLGNRVEATESGADTQLQDALIGNLGRMISRLPAASYVDDHLEGQISAVTDASGFTAILSSVDNGIREIEDDRSVADEASRARIAPPLPPSQPSAESQADRMALDDAAQAALPEDEDGDL